MNRIRFEELLNRYEDNLASSAELSELAVLLNESPNFRRELVERKQMEVGLHEFRAVLKAAGRPSVRKAMARSATRKKSNTSTAWVLTGVAAVVALLIGTAIWQAASSGKTIEVIARVEDASDVRAARSGQVTELVAGAPLYADDSISAGPAGRLVILYADGTRIALASGGRLTLKSEQSAKRVMLTTGQLSAFVAKQPAGQAMVLSTPNANATILGTQFKLTAMSDRTSLEVTEGVVRFTRSSDGRSIEVAAGRKAVAEAATEFAAGPIEQPAPAMTELGAAVLTETFEDGKIEGWEGGQLVQESNAASRYAIQATAAASTDIAPVVAFTAVRLPLSRIPGGKRDNQMIFVYQPELVLRFSYLLEGDATALRVQGFNTKQDDNFGLTLENPTRGKWAVAHFNLDDFLHNDPARVSERLKSGDTFKNISFFAGSRGQSVKRFIIDDVIIALPASAK